MTDQRRRIDAPRRAHRIASPDHEGVAGDGTASEVPENRVGRHRDDHRRDIGNMHGLAYALRGLGDAARSAGDHKRARETYGRARDLYQQIGFRNRYADVLRGLGDVARAQGDAEQADALYQQAYDICEQIGYRTGQADALRVLGDLAESPERARDYYLRARELYRQTGNVPADEVTERALRNLGGR